MPKYAKYLKSLLTNKSRLEEACTVTMNERCLAVLLNKLPLKEKDPGSFTIPCQVSHLQINNALEDLRASISLMPYTMYKKLFLREPKPTRMSLKLADRSIQYPRGIVENVLIKVDKFVLLTDFVILDMPEDFIIPIILGRPFLATACAMIDLFNKNIMLRVGDDEVIFDMDQSTKKPPTEDDECHGIDDLDDTINIETQDKFDNNFDVDLSIRRIYPVNTPYFEAQETEGTDRFKNKHLYSASTNEIDEKKPELEDFPSHLEYAYLHGNKSFPIRISSKLSEEEKISLLQVLTKRELADEFLDKHLMLLKSKFNDDEPCGHHSALVTAKKVYQSGFYWPSVFKDANEYIRRCDACQISGNISSRNEMPQNNIQVCEVFDVLGLDFMGPFIESRDNKYILVAVDYVSKCVKSQALPTNDACIVVKFLRGLFARTIKRILERSVGYNPKDWPEKLNDTLLNGDKDFKIGDKVLLYNSRLKMYPGKLKSKWSGSNIVKRVYPYGDVEIIDKNEFNFKVNGNVTLTKRMMKL
ncbi:reverse transcriptase domain-containing protein [Tanacetum coccineum]